MFFKQCRQNVLRHLCYNKNSNRLEAEHHLLEMDHKNRVIINWLLTVCRPWAGQLAQWHGKSLQSCPILCDPMDCSPPGSSARGTLQARILEWVVTPCSGDLPDQGIEPSLLSPLHWQVSSLPLSTNSPNSPESWGFLLVSLPSPHLPPLPLILFLSSSSFPFSSSYFFSLFTQCYLLHVKVKHTHRQLQTALIQSWLKSE